MRVVVVGGGAAGCAASFALARAGADVETLERGDALGGVATSDVVGGTTINDGVQGGATSYANARAIMEACGTETPHWVDVRVSFGRGEAHWRNHGEATALTLSLIHI